MRGLRLEEIKEILKLNQIAILLKMTEANKDKTAEAEKKFTDYVNELGELNVREALADRNPSDFMDEDEQRKVSKEVIGEELTMNEFFEKYVRPKMQLEIVKETKGDEEANEAKKEK